MNILQSLKNKFTGKGPRTVVNSRYEPETWTEWLDVDRVGMAIRAARGGSVQALFALYRDIVVTDSHIQTELFKRKLAVLGEPFSLNAYDKKVTADKVASDYCETSIYELKSSWRVACGHILDGVLWPVSVVEKVYRADGGRFILSQLIPVPHHLLDFSEGRLMIRDTGPDGEPLDTLHEPDPESYIVHRGHLLTVPDNYGGPMRSLIYWWLASMMSRDWWARFLDRYGMPFLVGKYEAGNNTDRNVLMGAFSASKKLFGLAVSKNTEVEIIEAARSGADCYDRFIAVCNREKSKLILGQTLSAQTDATGQGSGVADLQAEVRDDIRRFDASLLGETIRDQLLTQMCRLGNLSGSIPYIVWGSDRPEEIKATADLLVSFNNAGLELDDAGIEVLTERSGLSLRRKAQPSGMFTLAAKSDGHLQQVDALSSDRSAGLSRALRGFPADAARIIRESSTAAECIERLEALYADAAPRKAAAIIEDAMAIHAALALSKSKGS
jgi:phage gp29-like protein